jgi:glycosyltransferase involved in cell wall biosynthesis
MRVALNLEQCFQRPPGGIGRYASELARVLPDVGAPGEVTVVPFVARHSRAVVDDVARDIGIATVPVALPYPRPVLYELWNRWGRADPLAAGAARDRLGDSDVVHAPSVAVPPRGRAPLVVTVHDAAPVLFPDTYPRRGRRFHQLGFAAAAERADAIITPSAAAADEVADNTPIPRERISVIHHGVDHAVAEDARVHAAALKYGLGGAPYVLWVGTLEPRKDVGVLVDAFARVVANNDVPHRLVLVGPSGWLTERDGVARRAAPLGERVVFTGEVGAEMRSALYRGADVFALPSRHEGFGLPLLEAMAQGTAVLASDLPVMHEIAADSARFAPVGDADAWADALAALLGDTAARNELAAAGRARAQQFGWRRCAVEHLELYRSLA